jgi:hypothetical protein
LDGATAASIANAILEEDEGPDLDSIINRMLTLTPGHPDPSDVMREMEKLEQEREGGRGEDGEGDEDVPPALPPKQRTSLHPNGDVLNGSLPVADGNAPPPRVPPRRRAKELETVSQVWLGFKKKKTWGFCLV